MLPPSRRRRALAIGLALLVFGPLLAVLPLAPVVAAAAVSPPVVSSPARSGSALALEWTAVKGAVKYRVVHSPSSSFSGAPRVTTTNTSLVLKKLLPSTTYQVRVKALDAKGRSLTNYSAVAGFATAAASSLTGLAPSALVASATASTFDASWPAVAAGTRYQLRFWPAGHVAEAKSVTTTRTRLTVAKVTPATTYGVKVRTVNANGDPLSAYTPRITVRTDVLEAANPEETFMAPSGLRTTGTSTSAIALSFDGDDQAPAYAVEVTGSSKEVTTSGTSTTSAELTGLEPSTTYSMRVRVVNLLGEPLSPWSSALKATTRPSGSYPSLSPSGLTARAVGGSLSLSWDARTGLDYRVAYSMSADMGGSAYRTTDRTSLTLSDVVANTAYYVKVKTITADGVSMSTYSTAVKVVSNKVSAPLVLGSYNVRCALCDDTTDTNEEPWSVRSGYVAQTILGQKPDALGLQEASQARLRDDKGVLTNVSQAEDLMAKLGSGYRLVNRARYNCVHPSTSYKCVYADKGASKGTKIAYNSTTLKALANGSLLLSRYTETKDRYAAWAIFRHIASGKDFFFVTAHLESKGDSGTSTRYYKLRVKQMTEIMAMIAEHNTANLPVVLTGDFNSQKWTVPANGPYDVAVANGYVDPLGNTYRSKVPAATATVETRINTDFSSGNGFRRKAPRSSVVNGTYLDYILTYPSMRVTEWETVVNVDSDGNFRGVIPSDHNMIRATAYLP